MEVTDSDHKPVRCKFNVEVSRVDRSVRRQEFGKIFQYNDKIRSLLEELRYIPEVALSTSQIFLQNQETFSLKIMFFSKSLAKINQLSTRTSKHQNIVPEVPFAFLVGLSKWSEDTREEEVILMINVKASRSMEVGTHQVHLRCSYSANAVCMMSRNSSSRNEGSSHHRSNSSRRNEGSSYKRSNSSRRNEGSSHHRSNGSRRNEGSSLKSAFQQESAFDMKKYE
ncbi:hypothetical protein RND71_004890 [Anisodus tanguticus]|uniref:IP5PC-F immunoglobulin-like domain-containing protein n=1 Tax=Anisodus tanguticus TaxID=243964 RepID=A0AAE1VL01_9SOLA|nr:hypothetical protein RND71_004890 [Anisodus tanguticus]